MKSKTLILMGIAIVCGLGAAYMTSRLVAERNETVTVLIPKQKYGQWTLIKDPEAMFDEKEMQKNEAPKTAVAKMDDLKDRILLRSLPAGQPVVQEDLQDKNKGSLETQITPGMRAVAIKTDAPSSVGGFVLPGSHVDVYCAIRRGGQGGSKLILQNILVRAVDQQPIRPDDRGAMVPTTVTLEVSPEQALVLTDHKDSGNLTLALRSVGDTAEVANAAPPKPPPPPKPVPKVKPASSVQVAKKVDNVQRKYLTIFNGPNWTRATFITKNGMTTTEIENSQNSQAEPAETSRANQEKSLRAQAESLRKQAAALAGQAKENAQSNPAPAKPTNSLPAQPANSSAAQQTTGRQ